MARRREGEGRDRGERVGVRKGENGGVVPGMAVGKTAGGGGRTEGRERRWRKEKGERWE